METNYWDRFWRRRITRRRALKGVVLGGAGIAAAAVIGCGEEEGDSGASPVATGGASDQPVRGGTLRDLNTVDFAPTWDPHKSTFSQPQSHGNYGRLARHDLDKYPDEVTFIGDIAENWEVAEPTVWVFKINPAVTYQNIPPVGGRNVRASDVVFSYQRQKAEVNGGTLRAVTNVEAPDDSTVRVTLSQPDADLLWALSDLRTPIVPPESVEAAGGDLVEGPIIGSGAWIWSPNDADTALTASTRNPEFYIDGSDGQSLPYMERHEVYRLEDPNLEISAFRTGQIDIIGTVGQTTDLLKQTVPDLYVLDARLLNQTGDRLWIDPTVPPYTDQRVRQALAKLFNREQILDQVYFGSGWLHPMMFVPSLDWILPQSEFDNLVGYNPQQAQQLLQAAGVDPGSLNPVIPNGVAYQRNVGTAESFLAELARIGIRAQLRPIESQEVIEIFRSAKEPIAILNDPAPRGTNLHLFNYFHSNGGVATYWKKFADAEFDRLIEAQSTILEPEERKPVLLNAVRRGLMDAVASPTVGQTGEVAIQPRVAGYKNDTQEPYRFAYAWLKS